MELLYVQLPRVSRPVFESGSPTKAGPLPTNRDRLGGSCDYAWPPIGPLGSSVPDALRAPLRPLTREVNNA